MNYLKKYEERKPTVNREPDNLNSYQFSNYSALI